MSNLPLHELELLKRWGNHAELSRKLDELGLRSDLTLLKSHVLHVGTGWFRLGREHLADAKQALAANSDRATYSRAYYAAYSFSKAVRFIVSGHVSLKGDDHRSIGDLPKDIPDSVRWGSTLESLYDQRLRADYDNWSNTGSLYTLSPSDCVQEASDFHDVAEAYLHTKVGLKP